MIVGYYTQLTKSWTPDDLRSKLKLLPKPLSDKIASRRQYLDMQLSVAGYLLLLKLIDYFSLDLDLNDLQYGPYQRPYFKGGFDFNISHAGNMVICCATTTGKIGVDIEFIKPVSINLDDYFTAAEQQNIRAAKNSDTEFFKYWTRKEAVLKAIGTGVYTPLLDIDVSADEVIYKTEHYHLLPIGIEDGFAGCLAVEVMQEVALERVDIY